MTREEAINEVRGWDFLNDRETEAIQTLIPELAESEDERIIDDAIQIIRASRLRCAEYGSEADKHLKAIAYLENQKESIEKEYVFRPLAGTDITIAAEQAIRRANEGDCLVLAFNGAYIPVRKGYNASKIVDIYNAYLEKQKEPLPIPDKFSGLKSLMLQYLQSAANRKDDTEIESDTDLFGRKILDYVWKYSDEQKEQKLTEKPINWTELTWKDINELEGIINKVHYEFRNGIGQESFGKEVLEKFREYKGDEYLDEIEQKSQSVYVDCTEHPEWYGMPPKEQKPAEYIKRNSKEWYALLAEQYDKGYWKGKLENQNAEQKLAEWSEEDVELIVGELVQDVIANEKDAANYGDSKKPTSFFVKKYIERLKSLRPQPHWNPSEEQMEALKLVVYNRPIGSVERNSIESLYNDLKKL